MSIPDDRKNALEKAVQHVLKHLYAGTSLEQISADVDRLELDVNEVRWIWNEAKERYTGYIDYVIAEVKQSAVTQMLWSVGILAAIAIVLALIDWSHIPGWRFGMIFMGIAAGVFYLAQGAKEWLFPIENDRRKNISDL